MTPVALLLLSLAPPAFPRFEPQELATDLTIGYAVLVADLTGDGRPDILVVDKHRVLVYENPSWKPRVILQGKTAPDNVCAAVADLDGDGKLDVILGAGWKPTDTRTPGTLQWLKNVPAGEWPLVPIPCDEPTVHRIRVFGGELFVAPLQGRFCTAKGNWTDGRPVRILRYPLPAKPADPAAWRDTVFSEEFYTVHNFAPLSAGLLIGHGTGLAVRMPGSLPTVGPFNDCKGASEVAISDDHKLTATIEPWHGNTVVVYVSNPPASPRRVLLDDKLRWGHAVKLADLDGDGTPEVIAGVRDDPDPKQGDTFADRRGVRVYRSADGWKTFTRHLIDPGGVAVEDLAVADLDGDGRPDLVAVGRQTKNLRIYWNRKP